MKDLQAAIERIMFYEKKYGSPPDHMCYGGGYWLKKYLSLPEFVPLRVHMDHGVWLGNEPTQCQLKTSLPILVIREGQRSELLKHSKSAYVMGSPFVHCRRLSKIKILPEAKGTVCFPIHSTHLIDAVFDWQKYADQLAALPAQFHPITACLYWKNLLEKRHEHFIKNNIRVVTAGHMADQEFAKNSYMILASHQYCTSNMVGSFAFYSVEMGMPFFLYGEPALFNNWGKDHNRPLGMYDRLVLPENARVAQCFRFSSFDEIKITPEVRKICAEKLGLEDSINKTELRKVILMSWLRSSATAWVGKVKWFLKRILKGLFGGENLKKVKENISEFQRRIYLFRCGLSDEGRIFTHLTTDEKILIHQKVREHAKEVKRPLICVEIGSYLGASSCFIANAISEGSKLYCIDVWSNQAMRYSKGDRDVERDTYPEFQKNTSKYQDKIIEIRQWSADAIHALNQMEDHIDFLFIDGDHHYEGVSKDWELYSPLLRRGSLVAFHDTEWAEGVQRVISESVVPRARKVAELPNIQFFTVEK